MINKVILVGNLGRDPEVRSTPSGTSVATLSLATSRKWNDRDGQRHDETEWHRIIVWGRQAEVAGQYLRKGRQIYVEGRIHTNSWEDRQTGEKRYSTEIICENFQMLGSRGDSGGGQGGSYSPPGGYDSGGGGGYGGGGGGGGGYGGGGGGGNYGGGGGGGEEGGGGPPGPPGPPAAGGAPTGGAPAGGASDFGGPDEDDDIPF